MRLMKLLLVVSALVLTPLAFADSFSFYGYAAPGFDGGGLSVSGVFTATPGFDGYANVWEITGVSGSVTYLPLAGPSTTTAITTLISNAPSYAVTNDGPFIFDNLYFSSLAGLPAGFLSNYPDAPANGFDFWGLLFHTADGNQVNLFSNVGGPVYATQSYAYGNNYYFGASDPTLIPTPGPFSITSAPEPAGLILLGTGTLGIALGLRRKIAGRF